LHFLAFGETCAGWFGDDGVGDFFLAYRFYQNVLEMVGLLRRLWRHYYLYGVLFGPAKCLENRVLRVDALIDVGELRTPGLFQV